MSKILNDVFDYLADNVPAVVNNSIIAYGHDTVSLDATNSQTQGGVSGTWTYRKWSNGFFDCWGTFTMIPIESSDSPTGTGQIHFSDLVYVPLPPHVDTFYYEITEDTSVSTGRQKVYYELIDGEYVVVQNPTGNPHEQGWYEKYNTKDRIKGESVSDSLVQWIVNAGMSSKIVNLTYTEDETSITTQVLCYAFRTARALALPSGSGAASSVVHITLHGECIPGVGDYSGGGGSGGGGSGGGGGGGTTNYALLNNKPQIEGIELVGNQTFADLTLQSLTEQEILALIQEVENED